MMGQDVNLVGLTQPDTGLTCCAIEILKSLLLD